MRRAPLTGRGTANSRPRPTRRDAKDDPSMSATDKRKQSLYFPESMLQDIQHEAARLDRSLSWIVQRCVKLGLTEVRKLPSVNDVPDDDELV